MLCIRIYYLLLTTRRLYRGSGMAVPSLLHTIAVARFCLPRVLAPHKNMWSTAVKEKWEGLAFGQRYLHKLRYGSQHRNLSARDLATNMIL